MKGKNWAFLVLSICLVLVFAESSFLAVYAAPASSPTKSKAIELRMLTMNPMVPPSSLSIQRFIDIANQVSNGEYVVKFAGGPEAMSPVDIPSAIKNGVAEMGMSLYSHIAPLAQGVFPILHAEIGWPEMQKNGAADYIQELFHKGGLHHLVVQNISAVQSTLYMFSKKPIRKLEDFKGLRMGNPSPVFLPLWRALETEQVLVQLNDMYEAMSRGLVNSYVTAIVLGTTCKLQEVTKYGSNTAFGSAPICFYMSLAAWNRLSKTAQQNLSKASDDYDAGLAPWYSKAVEEPARQTYIKAGTEFISLSPEDDKKFRDIYREAVWAAEIKKNPETAAKLKQLLTKASR